jgi:hypothetical protein
MNFQLTDSQKMFVESVRRFARTHLQEGAIERVRSPDYPWDTAKLIADQQLMGITLPEIDGGLGGTLMDAVLAVEQISLVCPRSADVLHAGNFGPARALSEYGTPEQKKKYLEPTLSGHGVVAIGMTEPDAGSALTELKTTATPDGDGYRVNGTKIFTTYSMDATSVLAYVRFGPGIDGIGSVLIDINAQGLTFGDTSKYMSGDLWRQLYFDELYVSPDDVLLKKGGFKKQISAFNAERVGNSARALAFGRHAFNIAREHVLYRRQFGRRLCDFQGTQWKFAEMAMKLESAQLMLYKAAINADRGLPSATETAMAKHLCNQAGFEVANDAMQTMGATGYSESTLVDYCMRRTRGLQIAGGSLEMMKNKIAEGVFECRFPQRPLDD